MSTLLYVLSVIVLRQWCFLQVIAKKLAELTTTKGVTTIIGSGDSVAVF